MPRSDVKLGINSYLRVLEEADEEEGRRLRSKNEMKDGLFC